VRPYLAAVAIDATAAFMFSVRSTLGAKIELKSRVVLTRSTILGQKIWATGAGTPERNRDKPQCFVVTNDQSLRRSKRPKLELGARRELVAVSGDGNLDRISVSMWRASQPQEGSGVQLK
jgi:hypothetical protein